MLASPALTRSSCRVSQAIRARIVNVTRVPWKNAEHLQVLRYQPGQFYREHHDQNSPRYSAWGPRLCACSLLARLERRRLLSPPTSFALLLPLPIATSVHCHSPLPLCHCRSATASLPLCLSASLPTCHCRLTRRYRVAVAADTFFMYLSDVEEGGETRFTKLNISVTPRKGSAILWPSVHSHDPWETETQTYHEAVTVKKGEKYAGECIAAEPVACGVGSFAYSDCICVLRCSEAACECIRSVACCCVHARGLLLSSPPCARVALALSLSHSLTLSLTLRLCVLFACSQLLDPHV